VAPEARAPAEDGEEDRREEGGEEGGRGEMTAKREKRERELKAILRKDSRKWSALCVEQYSIKGRGVLCFHFHDAKWSPGGKLVGVEYLTVDDPKVGERGGWPHEKIPQLIEEYDPQSQFVFLAVFAKDHFTFGWATLPDKEKK